MKRERDPTPEEFRQLLAWLAASGRDYETIHQRLTRIFVARGCLDAENLADEVMNRVAVRIEKITETYDGDPARCFQGFAEKVWLEYIRDLRKQSTVEPPPLPFRPDEDEHARRERERCEQEDECLTRCMEELPGPDSKLFSRYFQSDEAAKIARKKLAAELGLTANALRIKAHRIRRPLQKCMESCLEQVRGPETIPA
jgi:RNA polymerase sigma factor (sigma-70 family)